MIGMTRNGAAGSALLFLTLTVYCKLHGIVAGGEVPLAVSARWAATATLCWSAVAALAWHHRRYLRAAAAGSTLRQLALFGLAIPVILATDLLSDWLGTLAGGEAGSVRDAVTRLYAFLPTAAMLSAIMMLLLVLSNRRTTASPAATRAETGWLDFPEAPLLRLRAEEILLIRSAGNYCEIVGASRTWIVRASIGALAERLGGAGFARVHRQTIVNRRHVRGIGRDRRGRPALTMSLGEPVPVGRRYRDALDRLTRG